MAEICWKLTVSIGHAPTFIDSKKEGTPSKYGAEDPRFPQVKSPVVETDVV